MTQPPPIWPSRLKVLLVEDNLLDAELTLARLSTMDCQCDVTRIDTEAQLREQLRNEVYDVILADFMLPMFSGPEALAIAQQQAPDVPFIFVSGVLGEEHAVDMLKQGATDYVLKQRLQRLPMTVRRAIGEAQERRSRIKAESALREYETGFRLLVDALRDYAVIGLDRNGSIRSWNSAAERLLGYRADEITGESVSRLYAGEPNNGSDEVLQSLNGALQKGSYVRDRWLTSRTGKVFFASMVTTAIRNDEGDLIGFSKIIRDTTEERRAGDALRLAKEQAEAANAAKDRFLAMLSHELRTPLTPILAATTFIEQRFIDQGAPLPDGLSELLPLIRRNIELEARLIDDLLDLNTISHGKLSLELAPMDLHEAMQDLIRTARIEAADKNLQINTRLDAARCCINGDAARVQQIIWNLLRNAIKFTPTDGGVLIETRNPDDAHIAIRVTDSGIGIGDAAMPRIFSAFEQADTSITRQFGGLGLGLAIAHALTLRHGGSLQAYSAGEGLGASFTVTLPLTDAIPVERAAPTLSRGDGGPLRILLVEDNQDTTLAMVTLLGMSGHSVDAAATVADARSMASNGRYDLLISDLGLPDGNGMDVVRAFAQHQSAPSIAMTGYGMDEDIRRCRDAGFTAHVTKPVGFDRLNELIVSLTVQR
ncbi:PAS domain S-box-containing protein [Hydrocarboniphaga daqingensis]|uniref:histidine kinase n=1 Tax=Hydrocarboniphaga daqingensis TaxID=490188 RepID=A0A1M5P910_9GAMM|nr:response regulator [Hydrocarboniphaga daqingensis]SHG98256.1 PAS domain S-box-containing protein [Hydrocarboniphaga daqingensis]